MIGAFFARTHTVLLLCLFSEAQACSTYSGVGLGMAGRLPGLTQRRHDGCARLGQSALSADRKDASCHLRSDNNTGGVQTKQHLLTYS